MDVDPIENIVDISASHDKQIGHRRRLIRRPWHIEGIKLEIRQLWNPSCSTVLGDSTPIEGDEFAESTSYGSEFESVQGLSTGPIESGF